MPLRGNSPSANTGEYLDFFSRPPQAKRNASESLTAWISTPHPSSASRGIGGCHLLLKEKALANPNQRASRGQQDKGPDNSAAKVTAENCRFAGTSSTAYPQGTQSGPPVHLAVPENCCGLTLILAVFDRCGKGALAFSATGSARASFPRARGRLCGTPRAKSSGCF